jgi:hypothetical protein
VLARNRVPKVLNIGLSPCRCLHLNHSSRFFKASGRSKANEDNFGFGKRGRHGYLTSHTQV